MKVWSRMGMRLPSALPASYHGRGNSAGLIQSTHTRHHVYRATSPVMFHYNILSYTSNQGSSPDPPVCLLDRRFPEKYFFEEISKQIM